MSNFYLVSTLIASQLQVTPQNESCCALFKKHVIDHFYTNLSQHQQSSYVKSYSCIIDAIALLHHKPDICSDDVLAAIVCDFKGASVNIHNKAQW